MGLCLTTLLLWSSHQASFHHWPTLAKQPTRNSHELISRQSEVIALRLPYGALVLMTAHATRVTISTELTSVALNMHTNNMKSAYHLLLVSPPDH